MAKKGKKPDPMRSNTDLARMVDKVAPWCFRRYMTCVPPGEAPSELEPRAETI